MDSSIFLADVDIVLYNFNQVLKLFIFCYNDIIKTIPFNLDERENFIRNIFIVHLRKYKKYFGIGKFSFEAEVEEISEENYETMGRIDIKIGNIDIYNQLQDDCLDENRYFAFECKRLDGYAEKNKAYISEGVQRFIDGKYAKSMKIGGMIGFVQGFLKGQDMNHIIDYFKKELSLISYLIPSIPHFNYSYQSKHQRVIPLGEITLYHLFFDFTQ